MPNKTFYVRNIKLWREFQDYCAEHDMSLSEGLERGMRAVMMSPDSALPSTITINGQIYNSDTRKSGE